jgi:hypothetical protein
MYKIFKIFRDRQNIQGQAKKGSRGKKVQQNVQGQAKKVSETEGSGTIDARCLFVNFYVQNIQGQAKKGSRGKKVQQNVQGQAKKVSEVKGGRETVLS